MNEHFDKPTEYVVCIDNSDYPTSLKSIKSFWMKMLRQMETLRSLMRAVKAIFTLQGGSFRSVYPLR